MTAGTFCALVAKRAELLARLTTQPIPYHQRTDPNLPLRRRGLVFGPACAAGRRYMGKGKMTLISNSMHSIELTHVETFTATPTRMAAT